jgi:hypothetical protein
MIYSLGSSKRGNNQLIITRNVKKGKFLDGKRKAVLIGANIFY